MKSRSRSAAVISPSPRSSRGEGWGEGLSPQTVLLRLRPRPASGLSDSHILKPQFDPELVALEGFEAEVHHFGTGFAVVGGPPAKPGDDPGRKGKCAFGMRVFLPNGLAFELVADRFQNALIIGLEGVVQSALVGAVATLDQLHDGDRRDA